jgi:predicted methyltransferase
MKLTRKLSAALLVLILGSAQSVLADNHDAALQAAINDRSAEDRSRDEPRQPEKTLKFFMVKSGMVVADGLPGGGW